LIFVAVKDCLLAEFGLGNEPPCDVNLPWNNRVNNKAGGDDDAVRVVDFFGRRRLQDGGESSDWGHATSLEQSCQKLVIFQIIKK
jgi:hypothetical protein